MKKFIFWLIATIVFSNSNASTDFACTAQAPNGVVQISIPDHDSEVVNDFFNLYSGSYTAYVEGKEIDLRMATIVKENGWSVIKKEGRFVIAFRRIKLDSASESDGYAAAAEIKYSASGGGKKVVKAKCFLG